MVLHIFYLSEGLVDHQFQSNQVLTHLSGLYVIWKVVIFLEDEDGIIFRKDHLFYGLFHLLVKTNHHVFLLFLLVRKLENLPYDLLMLKNSQLLFADLMKEPEISV